VEHVVIDSPQTTDVVAPQEEYWDCFNLKLSNGFYTLVDSEDFGRLAGWKWFAKQCGARKGKPGKRYAVRKVWKDGKSSLIFMHREILACPTGAFGDHVAGNTLDNRKKKLRTCSHTQNMHNQRTDRRRRNPYRGVYWREHARKWFSSIWNGEGQRVALGYFDSAEAAAAAWDAEALRLRGEFAVLNFPNENPPITGH
jgi:AP2 domain